MKDQLKHVTDEELILVFRKRKDPAIIGELFTRYTHLVYGVCLKYLKHEEEAKDAVMQITENLFMDIQRHEIQNFKSWLYSVTKNYCLMQLRKFSSRQAMMEVAFEKIPDEFMDSVFTLHQDNIQDKEEIINRLNNALNFLRHEQKTCIELLYLQQKSYKEVMELTGYSMKQVKSFIQNGKRNLGILLSKYHE